MAEGGAGADVVSEGELRRARAAGMPAAPDRFLRRRQVGARDAPRRWPRTSARSTSKAPRNWRCVSAIAAALGRTARVALRVNPDVDAGTHAKITTGTRGEQIRHSLRRRRRRCTPAPPPCPGWSRSGWRCISAARSCPSRPIRAAFARIAELVRDAAPQRPGRADGGLRRRPGHRLPRRARRLARRRWPAPSRAAFGDLDVAPDSRARPLAGRPRRRAAGRGRAGEGRGRFVVLDAAMNDLLRPAMYDAWHGIVPLAAADAVGAAPPGGHGRAGLRKPATHLRAAASCRCWRRTRAWRCSTPVPMVRS